MGKNKKTITTVISVIALCGVLYVLGLYRHNSSQSEKGKIKIVDQAGRTVVIPEKTERIVSLWPEATRVLVSLGMGDKIVGVNSRQNIDPIFTKVFPTLRNLPELGGMDEGVNIEELISLKPDIIFQCAYRQDVADDIQNKTGIPVVCVRINPPESGGRFSFDLITLIGECIHNEERAIHIKKILDDEISEITKITFKITESSMLKGIVIGPSKMINGHYDPLQSSGVINVGLRNRDIWYHVNLEQVIAWEPDIIFCHILHKSTGISPEYLISDPQWQKVKAVKNKRVYNVIIGYCGWYPETTVINMMQIAKTAYPDKFNDLDIKQKGNRLYKELYGIDNFFSSLVQEYNIYIP